jgi:hypothetical protein
MIQITWVQNACSIFKQGLSTVRIAGVPSVILTGTT